ncbi:EAL domain-containing protein [Motiliproteus coralliicola]|uniref:cyclic-guanylate-specific phosphodiesterase n=1 Tax=Motiliproteus coralliicola TaxID=2283196 RepID=A0A369WCM7_9GAMM|nr:EAL domain-containing protein [Motiliproteus coralliicola]RDE19063.1 EAL domain-containing protein [Motiliproteus coralliicola]
MNLTLKSKLLITIGLVFICSFGAVIYYDYQNAREEIIANLKNEATTIQGVLRATRKVYRHQFITSGVPLNDKTVGFLPAHALNRISDEFNNWVKSGLSFNNVSDRPRNPKQQADNVELEAMAFFRKNPQVKQRIRYFQDEQGRSFYHYASPLWITQSCLQCHGKREDAPLSIQTLYTQSFGYQLGELRGILSIKLPSTLLEERINQHLWGSIATYFAAFLMTFLAVFWLLKHNILNRLKLLTQASSRMASGEYRVRINSRGNDEISAVANAFDSMAEAVESRDQTLRDSEQRSRAIFESSGEGIVVIDEKGWVREANRTSGQIFGYPEQRLTNTSALNLLPTEGRFSQLRKLIRFIRSGPNSTEGLNRVEVNGQRQNGEIFPLELNVNDLTLDNEHFYLAVVEDISERKQAEQALLRKQEFLQTVIDGVVDPIMVIDTNYRIIMTNSVARQNIPEHLASKSVLYCHQVSHHSDVPCSGDEHPCPLRDVMESEKPVTVVHEHHLKDDRIATVELDASPFWGENGKLEGIIEVARDMTEHLETERQLRENEERLLYQASHDDLTELSNRSLFNSRLEHAIDRSEREGHRIAVLFLDLDRFKNINDSLGHDIGDGMLQEVAKRLAAGIRKEDTVARMGGDEFTIILEGIPDTENAAVVARKCLEILSEKMTVRGIELFPSVSIGISLYPEDATTVEGLMKCADSAMYRAKEAGRNTYQFYTPDMNEYSYRLLMLEADLRQALEKDQLLLHFQPQFNLIDGSLVGAEALIRWHHPERGMISPGDFIPLAEDTGLIVPIGEWVLSQATKQLRQWHQRGLTQMKIAVNVSARQFNRDLPELVARTLKENQLDPAALELEITESVLMENAETSTSVLKDLEQMGLTLAIDDFGTGYSSLSYLKQFPISTLKIDRSFIMDLPEDEDDKAIVSSVVALAKNMQLDVVAEGVETQVQLNYLQQLGCNQAQGFLLGRPLACSEFEQRFLPPETASPSE